VTGTRRSDQLLALVLAVLLDQPGSRGQPVNRITTSTSTGASAATAATLRNFVS